MQGCRGYLLSILGITQWCADQMVVVSRIEGKRPKFPPLIGLGQRSLADYASRVYHTYVKTCVMWVSTKIIFEQSLQIKYETMGTRRMSVIVVS